MVFDEWREWLPSQIGGSASKSDPEKLLFLMSGDNQEKIRRDVANVGSQMLRVDDRFSQDPPSPGSLIPCELHSWKVLGASESQRNPRNIWETGGIAIPI